jgi:hypothetical protein
LAIFRTNRISAKFPEIIALMIVHKDPWQNNAEYNYGEVLIKQHV